ncbi:MAG: HAMP domain-containing protein [Planctomycetes bacterium]|nr:HAMP domain-containing protein [Planctomycetota bacterium]
MRTRTRVLVSFVTVHIALSIVAGWVVWRWLDTSMRSQAEESAKSIGQVLAQGGFALNAEVLSRMRELTGHRFQVLDAPSPVRTGTIQVKQGGAIIEVDYRTEAYRRGLREIVAGTLMVMAGGSVAFGLVALWLSRQLARPLEELAGAARIIASGDLQAQVPTVGSGEVAGLAHELETMRTRLLELDRQHRQAERLTTLGTFTATIAHEVRNPLSAVRLTVQMLARRLPAEASLTMIINELERLDLIIDELLGFSKGMSVRTQVCDLRETVDTVVALMRRQADHAGVGIVVTGSASVIADPARMRQLVMNLLLNAIQAQHGGGKVQIAIAADGLAIEDEGPGVDAAIVPHLFEAFSSSRPEGTGLGLHLAKSIADAHGARLSYQRRSAGACFIVAGLAPSAGATAAGPVAPIAG